MEDGEGFRGGSYLLALLALAVRFAVLLAILLAILLERCRAGGPDLGRPYPCYRIVIYRGQ